MKKSSTTIFSLFLAAALFSGAASGAGESEYIIQKSFHSLTPIFMEGHAGDMDWVEGFTFAGEIRLNGVTIGTASGETRLWNPPMNNVDVYDQVAITITNNVDGMGSFEVRAQGVALGSSTTATSGDVVVSWSGSITNGTGGLGDIYGLSAGNIVGNYFAGTANGTEVLRLRFGF